MYAHNVIEDLQNLSKKSKNKDTAKIISVMIPQVMNSTKFHLGEMTKKRFTKYNNNEPHFSKFTKYLRMPYELCWLDYRFLTLENDIIAKKNYEIEIPKRGMLIYQNKPKKISVFIFNYVKELKSWVPPAIAYQIHFEDVNHDIKGNPGNITMSPIFRTSNLSDQMMAQLAQDDKTDLYILEEFMLLINARNIETKNNYPPEKLNLSRMKKGKQEIYTYKTLQLQLPKNRHGKIECGESGLNHNRIHYCRGHFKEYTSSSPLFGKTTGLFWWEPYARGKNKEGIIEKDYTCEFNED